VSGKSGYLDKVDREDLAQIVGTTRARISRFMNKFRRLGHIRVVVYRAPADIVARDYSIAGFGNSEDTAAAIDAF
jgi:hypothetical protein